MGFLSAMNIADAQLTTTGTQLELKVMISAFLIQFRILIAQSPAKQDLSLISMLIPDLACAAHAQLALTTLVAGSEFRVRKVLGHMSKHYLQPTAGPQSISHGNKTRTELLGVVIMTGKG
jgi:hypothetical protein